MASGIKAGKNARCEEEGEKPVPSGRCACSVVVLGEETGVLEAVSLGYADWEPDEGQKPVCKHDACSDKEDPSKGFG